MSLFGDRWPRVYISFVVGSGEDFGSAASIIDYVITGLNPVIQGREHGTTDSAKRVAAVTITTNEMRE